MAKKKQFKKSRTRKKTTYTRKKIARGVPRAVMMSETKMKKDIVDLSSSNTNVGSFYIIPYCQSFSTLEGSDNSALNPTIVDTTVPANPIIAQNLGNFITNGDFRSQRNGRRITMLNAYLEMVFHYKSRAQTTGDPPTTSYKYPMNPEIRVIQGWVKGGIDSVPDMDTDISSLYSEINFSRYKIIKDFIISRRALSALDSTQVPEAAASYAPIKLKFKWSPNRRITFDNGIVAGAVTTEVKYNGWVPFLFVKAPTEMAQDLSFHFDNLKRVLIFKDL